MSSAINRGAIVGIWLGTVAALMCCPAAARAQSAADGFNPGANGLVNALAVQADGKILIGGNFTTLGGGGAGTTTRNYIGRLNIDGSLDASFNPGANNDVQTVVVQADGKILVGGTFTMLGGGGTGTTARSQIGRLNADGSLDTSFNPGANGPGVNALAVQANGQILVGGTFTMLGGGNTGTAARNYLGRLNADGSLDASFNPGANGAGVKALAVQADGRILIGGGFTTLGGGGTGTIARSYIGRLNADGSLDSGFNPGTNDQVYAVTTQSDGKILVGGHFTALGGGTGTTPGNRIGRLNTDGSVDLSFNPGANNDVLAVAVQSDGQILVGGIFTMLGGGGSGTTARNFIGRINADGSLDPSFNPGATGTNSGVHAVAVQADGKSLVGGLFAGLGGGTGATVRNNIGRLYADGSVDADFNPGATGGDVIALAVQTDGKILVGGGFNGLGGGTRNNIGRLNADGSLDATFNPGANGQVNALTVQPDGKILVGGDFFTTLGGGGVGTTTRIGIGRLNSDGSIDSGFDAGASGEVKALAVQADGKILVGGSFGSLGGGGYGTTSRSDLGRLNTDGSLDASFNPGANGTVWAIAVQPDGKVLVGGAFTSLGGGGTGTTLRYSVARLNADGSLDATFNPGANGVVNVLTVQPDGSILVGGAFTTLGGGGTGTTPRNALGRLNADGSLDTSFNPDANGAVYSLAVQTDGTVLVGGSFGQLGGMTVGNLGRLNADGSLDPSFNPGAGFVVYALAMQADGKVLVGGGFTGFNSGNGTMARNFIARLTNTEAAVQRPSVTAGGGVVTWSRGGAGPEVWSTTFESSTDAATYTSLGSGTRVAGGWQLSGQNLATEQNLFIRARGYYTTGQGDGSGSVVESILNAYIGGAVTCPAITVSPASLVGDVTGVPYSQTVTQSGGGVATTAFAITSGALPSGLTLWSTGLLTGTPTQTGTYNFTVTATDVNGCNGSSSYALVIQPRTAPTVTTQPQSLTIVIAQAATLNVAATGTATLSYQWYQGATGATANPIGGATTSSYTTPALTATTSYWVRVTNPYGTANSATATITTAAAARAQMMTPLSGSTLTGSTVFFQWTSGFGVTDYKLSVGTTAGGVDIFNRDEGTSLSAFAGLPTTGSPVYVRLWSEIGSAWLFDDYQYTEDVPHVHRVAPTDFDGDGKADIVVYRPSSGSWYVLRSSTNDSTSGTYQWGVDGDVPVPGDYDGDGIADIAVYRPSNGSWYILQSSTGYSTYVSYLWGLTGDAPVPGDYDGDGKTDIAVYRPSNGGWYILQSSSSYSTYGTYLWGLGGDMPVPGDYDGDHKTDIAVYRPSNGGWYILQSSTNFSTYLSYLWGVAGDTPVRGDFDGDGKNDIAVYRPSTGGWYVLWSSTGYSTYGTYQWGLTGDTPVSADFDGDGKADVAVYRPSNGGWYILQSSTSYSTWVSYMWGLGGDTPLKP